MTTLGTSGQFTFVPTRGRNRRGMGKLSGWRRACAVFMLCAAAAIASPAKTTFTTLASFDGANGANPYFMVLVQGTDGNFYGTTLNGGANGYGTVFQITVDGTLTTLYSFCAQSGCPDGASPYAGLIQATDGNFYGTTNVGGANCAANGGCGTVFKVTVGGTLTTLYSFCAQSGCPDGADPVDRLVQAANGGFYGTTQYGGAYGYGTVFKITAGGTLTTLYSFCAQSGCPDGADPLGGLVQATNGKLYGTAAGGGANGYGTVFKVTPGGTLTTLYSFCAQSGCPDGADPVGGLVQATNGKLYGTTAAGGANNDNGTVFEITAGGKLTTLYSFCTQKGCTDGGVPLAGLAQATNGSFYGTSHRGGRHGDGTVFKITAKGKLTTLHSFDGTDGDHPYGGLFQATNGSLYGTSWQGGDLKCEAPYGCGTVFSLSVGLGPFVETLPTSGKVGAKIIILGTNLAGATGVSFNGTPATFTIVSSTEIKTSVPAGATTGMVGVTTPSGTLDSNVAFLVRPQASAATAVSGRSRHNHPHVLL